MTNPIDLKHLDLYVVGDRALLDEILSIFIEQAKMLSAELGHTSSDETWREAAHKLKGAARGVGAWALGDFAEAAEKASNDGPEAKRELAAQVKAAASEAVEFATTVRDRPV
ncbi:MAG TPA: Hpt domain-containing protein [Parvularculaceae bacterium]|nr:Hpt domain-containing protein [Parvularculaceae bacterium]HNS87736.1 Hpt domain-containing protein [Parvularculaceae bacterium]